MDDKVSLVSYMKPNEWAAIAFGLSGFVISCITLARSIKSDAAARALSQRQERQDLLALVIEAKLSYAADIRRWERVRMSIRTRDRVSVEPGDETEPPIMKMIDVIDEGMKINEETAEEQIRLLNDALAKIDDMRSELAKQLPKKYSESLSRAFDEARLWLTESANPKLLEEKQGPLFDKTMKILEEENEMRRVLASLRKVRKDALTQRGDL
jgi:hypothetical protein